MGHFSLVCFGIPAYKEEAKRSDKVEAGQADGTSELGAFLVLGDHTQ